MEEVKEALSISEWLHLYKPQLFIVVGLILTGIGGWISFTRMVDYREKNINIVSKNQELVTNNIELTKKSKKQSETNTRLIKDNKGLIQENTQLTNQNKLLLKSNLSITKSNSEMSQKLIEQTEIVNSEITGGDSYLKMEIRQDNNSGSHFKVSGIIEGDNGGLGKYNLRNIDIQIFAAGQKIFETLNPISELNSSSVHNFQSIKLPIPQNGNPILYSIQVITKNKKYYQYALLKKHSDDKWYSHTIYFNDLYKRLFRKEEFFPYNYPDELKASSPKIDELIEFERSNEKMINLAKNMLEGNVPIDFIISSTGLNKKQIEELKEASSQQSAKRQ